MQKWNELLRFTEICFREKSRFPKRPGVRFYYESQSKTHARDGSAKNKKIQKRTKPVKNLYKKRPRKRDAKIIEKPPKRQKKRR